MATVVLLGATYTDVPAVQLPSTGGSVVLFYDATDGSNLEYGLTDGSLPLVGIAQADYAHVWDDTLTEMVLGTGQIGTGRVV